MKLSQMGYKKVRCVFYLQDGKVIRHHNNPEKLIEQGDMELVVVYNPTSEQEQDILRIIESSREETEISIGGVKLLGLMELLTNIDLGILSGELTREEAIEIVENPNPLLQAVNLELNTILLNTLKHQFSVAQEMTQLPEAIKKPIVEQAVEKAVKEQEAKEQAEREEQEELEKMAELERQLEELKQKRAK